MDEMYRMLGHERQADMQRWALNSQRAASLRRQRAALNGSGGEPERSRIAQIVALAHHFGRTASHTRRGETDPSGQQGTYRAES